jgi:DNA-binding transcriptional ArsR family regulator
LKTAKYVRGLSNAEFRVLFFLLESANNTTYECYPSMKEIASYTEMEERTVQRHVSRLSEMGLFEKVEQRRGDGSRQVNLYRFMVSGTVQVGNQEVVIINGHNPQPAKNGRLASSNPPFQTPPPDQTDTTPRQNGRDISLSSSLESDRDNPPLPTGEEPPQPDLLGGLPMIRSASVDLVDQVFDLWNEMVSRHPQMTAVRSRQESRRKKVSARGKAAASETGTSFVEVWTAVFAAIEANTYLCGEDPPGKNYTEPFSLNIDFVLRPAEFTRILEGGYRANRTDLTHDPRSGRRFGPAEQGGRAAIARLRAADAERRDRGDDGSPGQANGRSDARPGRLSSAFDQFGIDLHGSR